MAVRLLERNIVSCVMKAHTLAARYQSPRCYAGVGTNCGWNENARVALARAIAGDQL